MYFISLTDYVQHMGVLGRREVVQLRVSIFINFKVFHTPHPYSFNNTVPVTLSVYFSDFNWAYMAITLSKVIRMENLQ